MVCVNTTAVEYAYSLQCCMYYCSYVFVALHAVILLILIVELRTVMQLYIVAVHRCTYTGAFAKSCVVTCSVVHCILELSVMRCTLQAHYRLRYWMTC
jgi:hypothetical protein